jgi:ankyrin repeat protein
MGETLQYRLAKLLLVVLLLLLVVHVPVRSASSIEEDIADMANSGIDLNAVNKDGVTMLIAAARNGNVEVVQALLKLNQVKRDVQEHAKTRQTALIAAIKANHPQIGMLLVRAGADVNAVDSMGQTALMAACSMGYTELVEALIARGAVLKSVDIAGYNALTLAASGGHEGCVRALIKAGINLNQRVKQIGFTALSYAAAATKVDMVKALVEAGASVNKVDTQGVPPIFHLSRNGQADIVSLLIAHGADVNIASKKIGETPLTGACSSGSLPTIQALLKAGANVNHQEYDTGLSPLMIAAGKGHEDIVRLLLQYGADVMLRRTDGLKTTAKEAALKNGHTAVAKIIENWGKGVGVKKNESS